MIGHYFHPSPQSTCCIVLSCPVLYCTTLSCLVLFCLVLFCPVLFYPVLFCPILSCPVLHCPVLPCTIMYYHPKFSPSSYSSQPHGVQSTSPFSFIQTVEVSSGYAHALTPASHLRGHDLPALTPCGGADGHDLLDQSGAAPGH